MTDYEAACVTQRSEEPLPDGRLSVRQYLAVHRYLFQDVYDWAGKTRRVRTFKDGSPFCYPENIERELKGLFGWLKAQAFLRDRDPAAFARDAAHFLAELNAIHAFRDGNGRAQTAFLALLAADAGHPLDFERMDPEAFLAAMVRSFFGKNDALAAQIEALIDPPAE